MNPNIEPLKVYYCYAKEDDALRVQLTAHLTPLRHARKLTIWLDVMILAGSDWKLEVEKHLKEADIILLLISPDFMASDYCYNLQLMKAFNYYEAGKVDIIPILLRPVLWEETPIKRLPIILPTSKIAVTLWQNIDQAFINIAQGIRDVVQAKISSSRSFLSQETGVLNSLGESVLSTQCPQCGAHNRIGAKFCKNDGTNLVSSRMIVVPKPVPQIRTKENWKEEGKVLYKRQQHIDALAAFEQALQLDPNDSVVHCSIGNIYWLLKRYPEALAAYEQSLRLDPNNARAYSGKGNVYSDLQQYPEALAAYEQALRLKPDAAVILYNKGNVFNNLERYSEALAAYEQSLQLDPGYFELRKNNKFQSRS